MANAKKCDLCGKYYEWYAPEPRFNAISLARLGVGGGLISDDYKDLCPDCRDAINDCIKKLSKERSNDK